MPKNKINRELDSNQNSINSEVLSRIKSNNIHLRKICFLLNFEVFSSVEIF